MEWLKQVVRDNAARENVLAIVLLVLFCGGMFFAAITVLKVSGLLSEQVAGWVQALGAIASIWGAYGIARSQARRQEVQAAEARSRQIEARWTLIRAVAYDCMEALGEARYQAMNHYGRPYFQLRPVRLEDCQYALRGLVVQELPPGSVEILLDLLKAVSRTMLDVQRWYDSKAKYPLDKDRFYVLTQRILRAQDDVTKIHGWDEYWFLRRAKDPYTTAP